MSEESLFDLDDYTIEQKTSGSISESCNVGALAEMKFCCAAMSRGYEVFLPLSHSTKTDVVLLGHKINPIRVQIKKATYQKKAKSHYLESWKFMVGSGRPSCAANPSDYGERYRKYNKNDFDILAAYILERDVFAFYNLSEIFGISSLHWNVGNPSNNWEVFEQYSNHKAAQRN